jgi:hypothetical protein
MNPEVVSLLRAMLEVQAESLRLQRLLVERLLATPEASPPQAAPRPSTAGPVPPPATPAPATSTPTPTPTAAPPTPPLSTDTPSPDTPSQTQDQLAPPHDTLSPSPKDLLLAPPKGALLARAEAPRAREDDIRTRGARYYQPSTPAAPIVKPEELELLRRLQQIREASGLILQFGPYKGTTLARVALGHPDYLRDLVVSAWRPEVRAAAAKLVEALDAAAEQQRTPSRRPSSRTRTVSH